MKKRQCFDRKTILSLSYIFIYKTQYTYYLFTKLIELHATTMFIIIGHKEHFRNTLALIYKMVYSRNTKLIIAFELAVIIYDGDDKPNALPKGSPGGGRAHDVTHRWT